MCALTQQAAAAVNNLRNMNAYVSSTLGDWPAKGLRAVVPRQLAPGTELEGSCFVGESQGHSFESFPHHSLVRTKQGCLQCNAERQRISHE